MKKIFSLFGTPQRTLHPIEQQAHEWMRKIAGKQMTYSDGEVFKRWIEKDPAHGKAFADAKERWAQLGQAGALVIDRQRIALKKRVAKNWSRRAFIGTALAGTAATAAAAVVHPPLGLWPSVNELQADYRTSVGEQQRVSLASNINVELSTRTSISVLTDRRGIAGIDLISGQTAVEVDGSQAPFSVRAGDVRVLLNAGQLEIRRSQDSICVTCLQGRAKLVNGSGELTLFPNQQITYDGNGFGNIVNVDLAQVSAWREGSLRFLDSSLSDVIEEINRYRPGRIVILDKSLAAKPVTGRFRLNALDKAIEQIQQSLNLRTRSLPGGLLLLS